MKSIQLALNSAYYAAKDRYFVRKASPQKMNLIDLKFYDRLKETSGPKSNNFKDAYTSWKKEFGHKYRMGLREKVINNQFKQQSIISKTVRHVARCLRIVLK